METGGEDDRHRWEPRLIRGLTNTAKVRGGSGGDGEGRTRGTQGQQEISFQEGCPSGAPNTSPMLGTASERHSGPLRRDLKKEVCQGGAAPRTSDTPGCLLRLCLLDGPPRPQPGRPFPNWLGPVPQCRQTSRGQGRGDRLLLLPHERGQGAWYTSHVSWAASGPS